MSELTYKAARTVANAVEEYFMRHLEAARQRDDENLAPDISASVIEAMIDTAFWASLRLEEGQVPKVSLVYMSPQRTRNPLLFENRLPLTAETLTKIGPGVARRGIHLGVCCDSDELQIWGTCREIQNLAFVLEIVDPGLLLIKHRRIGGFGKFANVAVLKGDQIKILDDTCTSLPDCPAVLSSLLSSNSSYSGIDYVNVLVELSTSMRAHGNGGTLLVVPDDTDSWRHSINHPIQYSVKPAFSELAYLLRLDTSERNILDPQDNRLREVELMREVEHIAGLTAVDGATILSDKYELLAFGAKIIRRQGSLPIENIVMNEPVVGGSAQIVSPGQSGGTRHLSAAQFVNDQRNALALVASQDGRFTIFSWSQSDEMVHADRIDALLM